VSFVLVSWNTNQDFLLYSKDMLNKVHTSIQNFQRPNSATLPSSWRKSASSHQSPSSGNSSSEQSPNGSVASLLGAQQASFESALIHSSRESTLDRHRNHISGEGKYAMSSVSSMGMSNPSPPLSESGDGEFCWYLAL
jgi:hypothetical protein